MYGHFTFFLIIISKAQARSKDWWEKNEIKNKKNKERKELWKKIIKTKDKK